MDSRKDRFLVIGAGPCGLGVAKALKDAGIAYDQVEADREVGGNWFHGVYETAHIISSRKTTEYSDFPMPAHYPDFPSQVQMGEYYRLYTDNFNLRENIEFETKAVMCRPLTDGTWEAELAKGTETEKRIYKGIVVCNGHHWDRRFPDYPGRFEGEFIHSKDFKRPEQLAGKRVLVIGGGNSACDVVSEAARVGSEAHLSLRRGYWFLPKTLFGKPSAETAAIHLPVFIQRLFIKLAMKMVIGKYEDYGLPRPDHKIFEHHPTLSSELLHYLKHGRIKPHRDIAKFEGKTVHFVDGESIEVDTVVCATGYYVSFPFLPKGLVPVKNGNLAEVYAGSVLPNYKNIYVFGTQQVRYGVGPLITPAAKLLARMMKMQDEMELPIGLVIKESGGRVPDSHLIDPIASLRRLKIANWTLPLLIRKERRMRPRFKDIVLPKSPVTNVDPSMQVY